MPRSSALVALLLIALTWQLLAGCAGTPVAEVPLATAQAADPDAAAPVQLAMVNPAALPGSTAPVGTLAVTPTLTLTLNTTLNNGGTIKAATLTKAELLNTAGTLVLTGTVSTAKTSAVFNLTGKTPGFYFLRLNGLVNDLVPTKIDSVTVPMTQYVGTTLRQTVVGTLTAPTYKMMTYSLGQAQHAAVNYTNGANMIPTSYAYAMLYLKTAPVKFETRILGKSTLLASYSSGGYHNMSTWAMGASSHGKSAQTSCAGCHSTLTKKATTYATIKTSNGWCYKCHYGATGSKTGMVNPLK